MQFLKNKVASFCGHLFERKEGLATFSCFSMVCQTAPIVETLPFTPAAKLTALLTAGNTTNRGCYGNDIKKPSLDGSVVAGLSWKRHPVIYLDFSF